MKRERIDFTRLLAIDPNKDQPGSAFFELKNALKRAAIYFECCEDLRPILPASCGFDEAVAELAKQSGLNTQKIALRDLCSTLHARLAVVAVAKSSQRPVLLLPRGRGVWCFEGGKGQRLSIDQAKRQHAHFHVLFREVSWHSPWRLFNTRAVAMGAMALALLIIAPILKVWISFGVTNDSIRIEILGTVMWAMLTLLMFWVVQKIAIRNVPLVLSGLKALVWDKVFLSATGNSWGAFSMRSLIHSLSAWAQMHYLAMMLFGLLCVCLILLATISLYLGLLGLGLAVAVIALQIRLQRKLEKSNDHMHAVKEHIEHEFAHFRAINAVLYRDESRSKFSKRLGTLQASLCQEHLALNRIKLQGSLTMWLVPAVFLLAGLPVVAVHDDRALVALGLMVIVGFTITPLGQRIQHLHVGDFWDTFFRTIPQRKRGPSEIKSVPKISLVPEPPSLHVAPVAIEGDIKMHEVSFHYADSPRLLLQNITINIPKGSFVLIKGPSGSGKTTMLRLLRAHMHPTDGAIIFDGQDGRSLDAQALKRHFGVVRQEPKLFCGTILENVLCGRDEFLGNLNEWLLYHDIFDLLTDLPMGLQTYIHEDRPHLSQVELTLILLLRAIVHKPKVLFLDEIYNGLSPTEMRRINGFLRSLPITKIIASHQCAEEYFDEIITLPYETATAYQYRSHF